MQPLSRILAPVDFSRNAARAVRWAGYIACHLHSELTLLHVTDTHDDESWRRRAESLLDKLAPEDLRCVAPSRAIRCGNPAEEIAAFARQEQSSLIVMGTHGDGPFRPTVIGSAVSAILRDVDCPVVTGAHQPNHFPAEPPRIEKILCAVEFSAEGRRALAWACQLAGEFKAQLTLAHITPSTQGGVGEYFDPDRRRYWVSEARQENFALDARGQIEEMQRIAGGRGGILIQSSMDVPGAICSIAERLASHLLVIGRGPSLDPDSRLRTTARSIIRQSPCPVLSV